MSRRQAPARESRGHAYSGLRFALPVSTASGAAPRSSSAWPRSRTASALRRRAFEKGRLGVIAPGGKRAAARRQGVDSGQKKGALVRRSRRHCRLARPSIFVGGIRRVPSAQTPPTLRRAPRRYADRSGQGGLRAPLWKLLGLDHELSNDLPQCFSNGCDGLPRAASSARACGRSRLTRQRRRPSPAPRWR